MMSSLANGRQPIDRKGILSFLAVTFAITYAVEGVLIARGFRLPDRATNGALLAIGLVMWAPTLAAVFTIKLVTREGFAIANLRFGPWRPYLRVALVIPACFALIYAVTWALGLGQPDWGLAVFRSQAAAAGNDPSSIPPPQVFVPAILLATLIPAPFINGLFGFGEELGWRGYLLPKLLPLGKARAYLIVGVVWGLWHAPLVAVGFNYPGHPVLGMVGMTALTTALSVSFGEMTLRYRSSILAGWMHGVFNSQVYGIWRQLLFPKVNPFLGGFTGLIGLTVWLLLGLWEIHRGREATTGDLASAQKLPNTN